MQDWSSFNVVAFRLQETLKKTDGAFADISEMIVFIRKERNYSSKLSPFEALPPIDLAFYWFSMRVCVAVLRVSCVLTEPIICTVRISRIYSPQKEYTITPPLSFVLFTWEFTSLTYVFTVYKFESILIWDEQIWIVKKNPVCFTLCKKYFRVERVTVWYMDFDVYETRAFEYASSRTGWTCVERKASLAHMYPVRTAYANIKFNHCTLNAKRLRILS